MPPAPAPARPEVTTKFSAKTTNLHPLTGGDLSSGTKVVDWSLGLGEPSDTSGGPWPSVGAAEPTRAGPQVSVGRLGLSETSDTRASGVCR